MAKETGAIIHGQDVVKRNTRAVQQAVEDHLFAPAVEGACRLIVNESKSSARPLAWTDVTGNLRASISFQVEHHIGARPGVVKDATGVPTTYNTHDYRSGKGVGGERGVVFAPMEYATHVEAKSSRSVLAVPLATVRAKLRPEMAKDGRDAWRDFKLRSEALGRII